MMRKPDRITVAAEDAVRFLKEAVPMMSDAELLKEIRFVFTNSRIITTENGNRFEALDLGVWNKLKGEIRLLKRMGFTMCMLIQGLLEHPHAEDLEHALATMPPCPCRYCT